MSKKDISQNGEYMPTAVGSWIYVWTAGGQKPPTDRSRSCMISAHGEQTLITSGSGAPKHVNLAYYCPNGYNLDRANLIDSSTRQFKPTEWYSPGQAKQDYKLTKYQGRHNSGNVPENYSHIQTNIHHSHRVKKIHPLYHESKRGKTSPEDWEKMYKDHLDTIHNVVYDIVTIRNREFPFGNPPTLFSVVAALEKAGFCYSTVHCFFCRGYGNPNKKDEGDYQPQKRK